jgi:cell division protein FtsQ
MKLIAMFVLAFTAIAFVENQHNEKTIHEVDILIHDAGSNFFLNNEEVYQLITQGENDLIVGNDYDGVELKTIENRVKANQYVAETQAFKDLKGNITIEVLLSNPIARILKDKEDDRYICSSGKVIVTSEKYTPRLILLSGRFFNNLSSGNISEDSTFSPIFKLVQFIRNNEFWKAQIAQMDVDRQGNVILYPQVTKQYIEFGKAEDIEKKFIKLKYFYKKILPYKGWNHYDRVNLKFKDQIICE